MPRIADEISALTPQFTFLEHSVTLPAGTTPTQLVGANPLRWALIISLTSIGSSYALLGITSGASPTTRGIQINPQSPTFPVNFRDYGGLVQQAWYATASGAGVVVDVIEVLTVQ